MTTRHFLLRALATLGTASLEILVIPFFPKQYPGTAFARKLLGLDLPVHPPAKRSVSVILTRLRHQGLVVKEGSRRYARWQLSQKGKDYLRDLSATTNNRWRPPPTDGKTRVVSFDVPERERRKRAWLRQSLRRCDYQMVQQSVWVGRRPLPEWFFQRASELGILECLDVFGVSHSGTITSHER